MSEARVLVTGALGYLGAQVVAALAAQRAGSVVAVDVREAPPHARTSGVEHVQLDVRAPTLAELFERVRPEVVVHLASIVTPGRDSTRAFEYSVDVGGTENVLRACSAAGVGRIVVSSSGAAYGYHADNPPWIDESAPLRGNQAFAYAWHKRLVEEMLARWRAEHPALRQVVFRIGTILGASVRNQITDLFEKARPLAIRGADSPFVFAWDQDVVGCIVQAVASDATGIYNVAGDGALTMHEIAARQGKRCRVLPAWALRAALALGQPLGLTRYGSEQLDFLRYRPVLSNRRLKEVFGYVPRKSSAETFDFWLAARRAAASAAGPGGAPHAA